MKKNHHDVKLMMWNNKCNHPEEDVMFKWISRDLLLPELRQFFAQKRYFFGFFGTTVFSFMPLPLPVRLCPPN